VCWGGLQTRQAAGALEVRSLPPAPILLGDMRNELPLFKVVVKGTYETTVEATSHQVAEAVAELEASRYADLELGVEDWVAFSCKEVDE